MLDKYYELPEELQHDLGEVYAKAKEVVERHGMRLTGCDNWAKVDEAIANNILEASIAKSPKT